ncbi:MAG: DUF554 domain-containing protein [Peptococcaceae bacterium]|nr:DUF554 domain-containing protein [Peptococcaceae bacterium]
MFATIVNMIVIVLGALLGICFKKGIPEQMKNTIMQGMGLAVILIGLQMAMTAENVIIIIISLLLGGILGEWAKLDERLNNLGEVIKTKTHIEDNNFVDGFVNASLIFCIGAMAIIGSIEAGLNQDYDILLAKSTLDGIMAVVLASSLGIGVAFSALAVFIYQGTLTLLAGVLQNVLTEAVISCIAACGGLLIVGIGLSIAEIKKINTINLLPSIFIAALLAWFII